MLQNQLVELNRKCEKLRKNIEWAKELEDCWTEFVGKEREHCNILEKYNCEDDSKYQVRI